MNQAALKMQPSEFEFLSGLLLRQSGLALTPEKEYLLESRLQPIARSRGLNNLSGLVAALKINPPADLLTEVVEAMTTNESLFFRDNKPFEHMKQKLLPNLLPGVRARGKLRIWSAAASTGQEPYSVAITLKEDPIYASIPTEIIGTDIAQKVLDKALKGVYSQFEVQRGLPITMLLKYFSQTPETSWQIKDTLKSMITFRQFNLLDSFGALGKFDIILCRNVLIYFNEEMKLDIVKRMCANLNPGGYLILGSAESIRNASLPLKNLDDAPGIYQLP